MEPTVMEAAAVALGVADGYLRAIRWFAEATEHASVQDALVTLAVRGPISTEN